MEQQAVVTNIQKFSVHDGPGIRSILFLKGCPLRCQWCANPENIAPGPQLMVYQGKCIRCGLCISRCSQNAIIVRDESVTMDWGRCRGCGACAAVCPTQARVMKGETMTTADARRAIDRDIPFYKNSGGGVTFSGGEPLLYPDFILEIAREYRAQGLNAVVETCGCVPWETFTWVQPWIDLFLYDLKFVDCEKHRKYCGMGNELILANLRRLCESSRVVVRIPIIPGINDTQEDIDRTGRLLAELGERIEAIHCLPYHNLGFSKYEALGMEYSLSDVMLPKGGYMETIQKMFEQHGLQVQIGG